jgi:hypothetical protein
MTMNFAAPTGRIQDKFLAAALFEERHEQGLDEGQLRKIAPSIFAETRHESRSERFVVIPTWEAIKGLMNEGFVPVAAKQGGTRIKGKELFTKHMVRFRHSTAAMQGSKEVLPEIVLRNAADGTSAYRVMAGGFRPICKNGLIAADVVADFRIGHTGNIVDRVIEGTWSVVEDVHQVVDASEAWQGINLTSEMQDIMAEAVHTLRFADADEATRQAFQPQRLLAPRREEDNKPDLWHTFNRLQENVIRGGMTANVRRTNEYGQTAVRRATVRPISSIDGDTALNKALWVLSTRMAELA